jgi:hypothetical protein
MNIINQNTKTILKINTSYKYLINCLLYFYIKYTILIFILVFLIFKKFGLDTI